MNKVTTFLGFNNQAEEAINFYVSLFKNSEIKSLFLSDGESPIPKGKVMHASFRLDGQDFLAMDGGPYFTFSMGTSLFVDCQTQAEIDELWEKLSDGGEKMPCGWVKDRYGMAWQIIPTALGEMMSHPESGNTKKLMEAMMKMTKIDIAALKRAYEER